MRTALKNGLRVRGRGWGGPLGRGTATNQVQGLAVHSTWLSNKAQGEGQGDEVSQAGRQGSVMPHKGIWIRSLAGRGEVWGSGIAGEEVGHDDITLVATGGKENHPQGRWMSRSSSEGGVQVLGCWWVEARKLWQDKKRKPLQWLAGSRLQEACCEQG